MPLLKKLYSFDAIISRLENILNFSDNLEVTQRYKTSNGIYPLIKIVLGKGNPRRALISAGIHGDEPGGVETIVKFLKENIYLDYLDEWEITLLPCINPFGYEFGIRENHQGKDLNRLFKADLPPSEVVFVQSIVNTGFEVTIELHEDNESNGYYLYQIGTEKKQEGIGLNILNSLKLVIPINLDEEIDGSKAERGVIGKKLDIYKMEWWPMALYSFFRGTQMCLTLEAPSCFELKTRVNAHLIALSTALNQFQESS
tara:strand:+ start:691 stop:1461 length:771 start_codon:yes stop_codon:yes gene_type:complete